ncbi:MAG TPA: bifunctional DNA primase/polymerase [Pirellulales bacterium]|nr:bifunctional DNA primase/polymerase [Pirellulales bacterium]
MDETVGLQDESPDQTKNNARVAARQYARRGWSVIPIPHKSKNPGFKGWEQMRLTAETISEHFNSHPQNIGVLLGEPSAWLVDIDLDHPRAVALADQYLPPTPLIFGRAGKPRSHRLYRVSSPVATKKFKSKSAGMIVELRSTGAQTVFPPSTHESGEVVSWEAEDAEPALIDPEVLIEAVQKLAEAVLVEFGERSSSKPRKEPKSAQPAARAGRPAKRSSYDSCLAAMLRMNVADHNDGSGRLYAAACRVVEHNLSDQDGIAAVREFARQKPFPVEWTDDQIRARVCDAEKKIQRGVIRRAPVIDGKPTILIDTDEYRVVCQTVEAMKSDPELYQRGGVLVRVVRDAQPEDGITRSRASSTIAAIPPAALRERMTRFAGFSCLTRQGDSVVEIPTHPTAWLVNAVHVRADWPGIRYLAGISDVPILRSDGSIWQDAGYDPRTGVLFEPVGKFPSILSDIGAEDVNAALKSLLEVVCDFEFESDDHRAAWLAGLLTPFARFAFEGPSPLFLIDANIRGAGKGLLAQTIGHIVIGGGMPVSSYAHDSEEMRKKITAIALAGDRMILLDNLEGKFGNDALDRALTSTRWRDRILGTNQQVDLPLLPAWYATGNNVIVGDETTRRIIHIRLDVLKESPEERAGFRHPQLLVWIRENRDRLVAATLTLLAGFMRAGRPKQDAKPFGSFEGWSSVVREAVIWAGLPDPCRTRVRLAETSNSAADALGQFIAAWRQFDSEQDGIVVADMLSHLYPSQRDQMLNDASSVAMRAAVESFVNAPPGKAPSARQVGNKLRHYRRRVVGGVYLDTNPKAQRRNGALWRLHSVEPITDVRVCDSATLVSAPFAREDENYSDWNDE